MINTLHIFNEYLNKTENWAYQLISNTPECKHHVAAKVYMEHKPGKDILDLMENPLSELEKEDQQTDWKKNIVKKAIIRTSKKLSKSFEGRLEDFIKEKNINLLHAHFANMGWEMIEVKKKSKLPLVVSFYGWDYEMLPHVKPQWVSRYQELFDEVDMILTEGEHGKSSLIKMGCNPAKLKVQKLGVEKETIRFKERSKKQEDLHLIQIASFTEKKGQLYTVRAFIEALKSCPNMRLTLIGDSREQAYKEQIQSIVKDSGHVNRIIIKDFIPYEELNNELVKHHVFIHPSCYADNRNCEGGAPTIIFNAAGSGMPTIATTHCDIPALVVDQKTGLLSPEKSISDLAESISQFYKMGSREYLQYGLAAHEHIKSNYSIEENGKNLYSHYQSLIKNHS